MPRTRNPKPTEFRDQLVALARAGRSVESLARGFELCAATIHGWVKQVEIDEGDRHGGPSGEERDELRRLRQEVEQLRQERDILSKAAASGTRSRFSGSIGMEFSARGGTWTLVFTGGTVKSVTRFFTSSATALTVPVIGSFAGITFTSSTASTALTINTLTANIACFCAGTMIATLSGEVAVEALQPGDRVLTAEGGQTTVR